MSMERTRSRSVLIAAAVALLALAGMVWLSSVFGFSSVLANMTAGFHREVGIVRTHDLLYTFNSPGTLNESVYDKTTSPYWWLNSGGQLIIADDIGSTVQGELPFVHHWRLAYARSTPIETDDGYHPQNIFRLVSREQWDNSRIEASFRIVRDNLSASEHRNESNGLFLMSRYTDQNNLYYAGIRVDGHAVIKKKYAGTYYTLVEKRIFPGSYNREVTPNLLPHSEWLHVRSETVTLSDGSVGISLFMRRADENTWTLLVQTRDTAERRGGTPPITQRAPVGIRTDFMDVEFDNIRITEL